MALDASSRFVWAVFPSFSFALFCSFGFVAGFCVHFQIRFDFLFASRLASLFGMQALNVVTEFAGVTLLGQQRDPSQVSAFNYEHRVYAT